MPDIRDTDLQFQESRQLLVRALKQQGFAEASAPDSATLAIFLSYGIGAPIQQTYTHLAPQLGLVPQSTTTQGSITTSGNTSNIAAISTTRSQLGVTGFNTVSGSYTSYTRYLLVSAVDLDHYRKTKAVQEVWKTVAVSTGMSGDLRLVLPYLIVASRPYLGTRTDHAVDELIPQNDPRVIALKKLP